MTRTFLTESCEDEKFKFHETYESKNTKFEDILRDN